MNKEQIDAAIATLRKATFPDSPEDKDYVSTSQLRAKESFDASMVLVRDALVCLNVLAGRGK